MKRSMLAGTVASVSFLTASAFADLSWSEDFDSYANGSGIIGQGGWTGWDNDPGTDAFVTDAQSRSAPHSLDVTPDADVVREFSNKDSGQFVFTAWQYVPGDFQGVGYFILLNTYNANGSKNWSTQVQFDSGGVVHSDFDGAELPLITDRWVELRVEIDLDVDSQSFYYDNDLLYTKSWTEGVTGGGDTNIAAVNLFANPGSTSIYYDDLSLIPAPAAGLLLVLGAAVGRRRRSA